MADPLSTHVFKLQVITPEHTLVDIEAKSVRVPCVDGMTGVLANHAPLVAPVVPGEMMITPAAGEPYPLAVGEGFLEVVNNRVRVMVDSAERPEEIDLGRAEAALTRARERLAERGKKIDIDFVRAELSLRRAMARLRVGRYYGSDPAATTASRRR